MADYRNALDPIDMGGYSPEQAWRGRYRVSQGGVLDTLPDDAPMPSDPVQRNALAAYLNQGLGLVNHYAMGIPATMAGLVNAAIPGQPLGDMWSAVQSGRDAADEFAANGRGARDLLSLPDAFGGHIGSAPHVPAGARLTAEGAAQAGRGIDNALTSAVRAMPDNAVGAFGGRLPKGITATGETNSMGQTNYAINKNGWLRPSKVGNAYVRDLGENVQVGRIHLDPEYQRQGIGTALYGQIEQDLGKPLIPDGTLSESAYNFWLKHRPEAVEGKYEKMSPQSDTWTAKRLGYGQPRGPEGKLNHPDLMSAPMVAGGGMAVSSSDVEAHPALIPLLIGVGAFAGGLSNDADRAELMLNRQSPRLYDYAPQPGMLNALAPR